MSGPEDGKFAEVWDHTDMDAVMRQVGQGEATFLAHRRYERSWPSNICIAA